MSLNNLLSTAKGIPQNNSSQPVKSSSASPSSNGLSGLLSSSKKVDVSAPAPEVSQETQPSSLWGKIKNYLTKTDGQFNTQSPFTVTPAQPVKIEPYKAPDFTMKASDIDNGVKNGTIQPISSIHGDGYKDELGNIYDKTGKQIYKTPMSKTLGDVGRNIGAFAGLTSNAILTDAVKGAIDIVNMSVSGSFTPNEKNPDGILSKASKGIEDFRNKLAEDTKTNIMTGKDTTKQGIIDTSNLIGGIFSFALPETIFGKVGEVAGGINKLSKTYDALIAAKDFQKATEVANQIQKTTSIVSKAKGATMAVYGGLLSGYNDAQSVYNDTLNNIKEWRGGNITEQDKQVALQKANEAGTKSTLLNTLVFGLTHSLTEKASNGIMNKLNIPQSSFADTIKSGFSGANTFALQTMVGNYVNNRPIFENVADQATMGGIISGLLSAVAGGSVYRKSNEVKQDQKAQIQRQNDLNTLGVNENSTPNEIRSAYINLAKTNHPDTGGNAETMAKINDAYSRLHPSIKDINTLTDEMNSMAGNNQAAKDIIKQESQKAKDFIVAKEHIKDQLEKDPSSSQTIYADLVKSGIPEVNSQAIIDNAKNEIISELSVKKEENRVKNNDSIKNTPENDKLLQEAKKYNTPEEFINSKINTYHGSPEGELINLKSGKDSNLGQKIDIPYITKEKGTAEQYIRNRNIDDKGLLKEREYWQNEYEFDQSEEALNNIEKIDNKIRSLIKQQKNGNITNLHFFGNVINPYIEKTKIIDILKKSDISNISDQEKRIISNIISNDSTEFLTPNVIDNSSGIRKILLDNGIDGLEYPHNALPYSDGENGTQIAVLNKDKILTESNLKDIWNQAHGKTKLKSSNLTEEAKKYDTLEEFIKAQGEPIYHGTNADFEVFDKNKIGSQTDIGLFGKGFYFGNTESFAKIAPMGKSPKNIMEVYPTSRNLFDISKIKSIEEMANKLNMSEYAFIQDTNGIVRPKVDENIRNSFTSHLQELGYDGVVINRGGDAIETVIFEPENIKTEKQLKDIWNQAHSEKNAIIDNYGKDITSKDSKSSSNSSKSKIRFEENITDKDKVEIEHDLSTLDEDIGDLYADIKYSVSDHIETEQNYNKLTEVAQIYNRIEKINQDTFGIKSVTKYADSITGGNGKLLLKYKFYAARHGEGSFSAALSKAQHRYDKYGIKKPLPAILKNYDTTELASYLENTAYKDMNVEDAIDELIDKVSSKNEFIKSANTELKRLNKRAKELSKELKINQDAIWDYVDYDYNIGKKIETKTPQEAPSKIETATEDPEIKKSRAFQRLKHKIDAEYQNINEPTYQVKHRDEEIAKAIELYKQNPKYAERVALGLEKAPEDISETMISRVVEDMAAEKGDSQLQADTLSLRSLKQTIRGQELAMEGTTEENSAEYFIKRVLQKRRELAQKGYNPEAKKGESIEKQINKKKSKMGDSFRESVKIKAKYLDDFLDEITCPY